MSSIGLRVSDLTKLLRSLSSDFPDVVMRRLLRLFSSPSTTNAPDNSVVPFVQFTAAVHACLLYQEFIERMETIFLACNVDERGRVMADVLQQRLQQCVSSWPDHRMLIFVVVMYSSTHARRTQTMPIDRGHHSHHSKLHTVIGSSPLR